MESSTTNNSGAGADAILNVLEGKAFYKNRFYEQVKGLYPSMGGSKLPRLAPKLYLTSLLARLPEECIGAACAIAARNIVDRMKECPSPAEVRQAIVDAALEVHALTPEKLYERAKDFLAFKPQQQSIADRWIERVIYTSIKKLGRDHFAVVTMEEWSATVSEVMISDSIELVAYEVKADNEPVSATKKFDYRSLLP